MTNLRESLTQVRERIERACSAAGRASGSVGLVAVSKTVDADRVREAAALGQRAFGENYVQEALEKQARLGGLALEWHFIGPVQSNKTRDIAAHFDWVHGVDRLRIAQRLSDARDRARGPLQVCVQVNISGEASKSGCDPADAAALCAAIATLPGLRLRGLMAIPAPVAETHDAREPYRRLRELFGHIRAAGTPLDTISAGMTDDLEAAIAEGSTLVRVGTALFGRRDAT
jgi:PLP dependent protein